MADAKKLIKSYLQGDARTMQLATVVGGKPWVATVYFVVDSDINIYWLSWPDRRHSQAIKEQSQVAAAIVIKIDQPVIGVQLSGIANEVTDAMTVRKIMTLYVAKYNTGAGFYEAFVAGTNRHHMYRLVPTELSLFDEVHCPGTSPILLH